MNYVIVIFYKDEVKPHVHPFINEYDALQFLESKIRENNVIKIKKYSTLWESTWNNEDFEMV